MQNINRNIEVDLAKIIACILIVVLHVFGNEGSYISRCIYLIGSFGIPLFFFVNGYLLYERKFTEQYIFNKIKKNISFFLMWVAFYSMLKTFFTRDITAFGKLLIGAVTGTSELYHLWFLCSLSFVYVILLLIEHVTQKYINKSIQQILSKRTFIIVFLIVNTSFIYSLVANAYSIPEIREVLPVTFRFTTSLGYFFLGMLSNKYKLSLQRIPILIYWLFVFTAYLTICIVSYMTGMIWASSYYDSLLTMLAILSVHEIINWIPIKHSTIIARFSKVTTGVWILHPFINRFLKKLCVSLKITFLMNNIVGKLIALVIVVFISFLVTELLMKNKITKKLVSY